MSEGGSTGERDQRAAIGEAAVRVLAGRGIRGFTHDVVDAESGLPEGASAALYPDRDDLIGAAVSHLVVLDGQLWTQIGQLTPDSVEQFAQRVTRWVELALGTQREAGLARLELFLGDPKRAAGGHLDIVEMTAVVLDVLGVAEPGGKARLVIDLVSGTMAHYLTVRADESFDAAAFEQGVLRLVSNR